MSIYVKSEIYKGAYFHPYTHTNTYTITFIFFTRKEDKMFKKLRIKKKLILSFIVVALVASISGIFSILVCTDMNKKYSDAMINLGFSQGDIGLLGMNVIELNDAVKGAAGYQDPAEIQAELNVYQEHRRVGDSYLEKLTTTITTDDGRAALSALQNAYDAYLSEADSLVSRINPNMTNEERLILQSELSGDSDLKKLYMDFYNACQNFMTQKSTLGINQDATLSRSITISVVVVVVLLIASLLLSIILGIAIATGISKPINACVNRLRAFKKGDISSPAPHVNTKDEMFDLTDTFDQIVTHLSNVFQDEIYVFNEMAHGNYDVSSKARELYIGDLAPILEAMLGLKSNMTSTLQQIRQNAEQVASGSEQIATASQALSQGATEQASSVQELAATVDEISKRVNENAHNANNAADVAKEAGINLESCNQQMQALIAAMDEISTCSSEIGKIIKTIEDIAFQTNILALNAAVEAARAGTAGKGFAVVADEVRNLASKSAEASKNTATLIANAIRAVENGSAIVNTTADSMSITVTGAEKAVTLLEQINAASAEQADSISQVSVGIDQISAVVQTNSATAEEVAASSEELSTQSDLMKSLVEKFKLSNTGNSADTTSTANIPSSYNTSRMPAPSVTPSSFSYDDEDDMDDNDSYGSNYNFGYNDKY